MRYKLRLPAGKEPEEQRFPHSCVLHRCLGGSCNVSPVTEFVGAADHCHPEQIPAARVAEGGLGCAALQLQEFASAPVLLGSNSSSPQFLPRPVLLHLLPNPNSSCSVLLKITKKSWG